MVTVWIKRDHYEDGSVVRKVFATVTDETVTSLSAVSVNVPDPSKGYRRTAVRVRVSRSGSWAVWRCRDVPNDR